MSIIINFLIANYLWFVLCGSLIVLLIGLADYWVFCIFLPKLLNLKNDRKWYSYIPATLLEYGCFLIGLGIGIKFG